LTLDAPDVARYKLGTADKPAAVLGLRKRWLAA